MIYQLLLWTVIASMCAMKKSDVVIIFRGKKGGCICTMDGFARIRLFQRWLLKEHGYKKIFYTGN